MRMSVVLLLLGACAAPGPAREPRTEDREPKAEGREPKAEDREPKAEDREPKAEDLALGGCELRVQTVVGVQGDFVDLSGDVQNLTSKPIEVALPSRCPKGFLDYTGLAPGFDYHGTCHAGACAADEAPLTFSLEPQQWHPLPGVVLQRSGRAPCQPPLRPGVYAISVVAPADQRRWCVAPARLELEAEKEGIDPRDPYACESAADCVLSCPRAKGCCGDTCGCKHAINRRHVAAYEARYAETCTRPPCPAMGCAHKEAMGATCRANRCQPTFGPGDF